MSARPILRELSPKQVHEALRERCIVLVDVRKPQEYVTGRINGALLFPLSTFDPLALPIGDKPVVLHCGCGKRSSAAIAKCIEAGVSIIADMKGGILSWRHNHLATVSLDPDTGAVMDRR